jgi:hypothetical protein
MPVRRHYWMETNGRKVMVVSGYVKGGFNAELNSIMKSNEVQPPSVMSTAEYIA